MKEKHCISVSCKSRRSKCCNAKPKTFTKPEGGGYFICATCGNPFQPKEHSCAVGANYVNVIDPQDKRSSDIGVTTNSEESISKLAKKDVNKPDWEKEFDIKFNRIMH